MKDLALRILGTAALAALTLALGKYLLNNGLENDGSVIAGLEPTSVTKEAVSTRPNVSLERNDVYYQAILERPVFEVSRRPVTWNDEEAILEPIEVQPEVEAELPQVSLLGVMSEGSHYQVLISVEGREGVWFNEGDKIGDWTIAKAGENWLELASDNKKVRLELFK